MEVATLEQYYKEHSPMKRKKILDKIIEEEGSTEENLIRQELWETRYSQCSEIDKKDRADGFLGLWMLMEYNKEVVGKFFGGKRAVKDLEKKLDELKISEYCEKSDLHKGLLYKECVHLVKTYVNLCMTDKSYNSTFCGLIPLGEESSQNKIKADLYKTAVVLPQVMKKEKEFEIITKAASEVFEEFFPDEGGLLK